MTSKQVISRTNDINHMPLGTENQTVKYYRSRAALLGFSRAYGKDFRYVVIEHMNPENFYKPAVSVEVMNIKGE